MKGVVLAGGLGSRLRPMTVVTNKHLLPVYDRPMIYYPLQQLAHAGVREIMVVTGGRCAGDFLRLLGNGKAFGLDHLNYAYQDGHGGIAEALGLAEHFADSEPVVVVLGDNIFQDSLAPAVSAYRARGEGAMVLLKDVPDPQRFGVAELAGGQVRKIVEKPQAPPSNLAVTGCYFYDGQVFDMIRGWRGRPATSWRSRTSTTSTWRRVPCPTEPCRGGGPTQEPWLPSTGRRAWWPRPTPRCCARPGPQT